MKEYPKYVTLKGTALEHRGGGEYFRLAGLWSVNSKWKDDKLFSKKDNIHKQLSNIELIECDYDYWAKDNDSNYIKR